MSFPPIALCPTSIIHPLGTCSSCQQAAHVVQIQFVPQSRQCLRVERLVHGGELSNSSGRIRTADALRFEVRDRAKGPRADRMAAVKGGACAFAS